MATLRDIAIHWYRRAFGAPKGSDIRDEGFTTVLDGRNEETIDGVQRALGRPPRDFREYAKSVAATGVWNAREQGA